MKIHAKEYAACIIDTFEDFLEEKGIEIPNQDKTGNEGEAILYGDDFDYLMRKTTDILEILCKEANIPVDTEHWEN